MSKAVLSRRDFLKIKQIWLDGDIPAWFLNPLSSRG